MTTPKKACAPSLSAIIAHGTVGKAKKEEGGPWTSRARRVVSMVLGMVDYAAIAEFAGSFADVRQIYDEQIKNIYSKAQVVPPFFFPRRGGSYHPLHETRIPKP